MQATPRDEERPERSRPGFVGWVSDLARRHTRRLVAVARAEGLPPEEALDAVQEAFHAFLLLPQARTLVAQEREAAGLLGALVRNVSRNQRRRHHRARPHEALPEEPALPADGPSVEEALARAEEHVRLLGCVNRLAELQRKVVTLRMLDEVGGRETAERLGLAPERVAVLLHRAKKDLLACMLG